MSDYTHTAEIGMGDTELTVDVTLECVTPSEAPSGLSGPPEYYDPGGPAEFEFESADVSDGTHTVTLKGDLFWALLGDKAQILYDNAVESAQDSGEF